MVIWIIIVLFRSWFIIMRIVFMTYSFPGCGKLLTLMTAKWTNWFWIGQWKVFLFLEHPPNPIWSCQILFQSLWEFQISISRLLWISAQSNLYAKIFHYITLKHLLNSIFRTPEMQRGFIVLDLKALKVTINPTSVMPHRYFQATFCF